MRPFGGSLALATLAIRKSVAAAIRIIGSSVRLMGPLAMPSMRRANDDVKLSPGIVTAG
jgi:TRAP-type mannitol/chloroaromatic compound transport system permease large subunit